MLKICFLGHVVGTLCDSSAKINLSPARGEPVAVDVTVTHPLAPSLGISAQFARNSLDDKEKRKMSKHAAVFADRRLAFVPFALTTFGEVSTQADQFLDEAAEYYGRYHNVAPSFCRYQLMQSLHISMLKDVGKRLLAGVTAVGDASTARYPEFVQERSELL